jgi:hypothetical protein
MEHHPPARLGDLAEANYRRHITMRAAALGVREADLSAAVEWRAILHATASLEAAS